MTGRRSGFAILLSTSAVLAGCVTGTLGGADPFQERAGSDEVLLTVHNEEVRNADVYAYWNGMKERVGTVLARQSETFTIKWRSEEVRIGYELLGRRAMPVPDYVDSYVSGPIGVTQGDHLDFKIIAR